MTRCLDLLAFSSLLVAGAAAALAASVAHALGGPAPAAVPALAFAGTLVVYNLDRLRDEARDRATSPERTRFVRRYRRELIALIGVSGAGCVLLAWALGPPSALVLAPALGLGLLHRRIKELPWVKPLYITTAWALVVVALPAVVLGRAEHIGWIVAVVAAAVLANAIASNVRDHEAGAARFGRGPALAAARVVALLGVAAGGLAPTPVRPLLAVPVATLAALSIFREGERYGLVVVDGALLAGAVAALALQAA